MLTWFLSLVLGTDTGSCIDPNDACSRGGSFIDPIG